MPFPLHKASDAVIQHVQRHVLDGVDQKPDERNADAQKFMFGVSFCADFFRQPKWYFAGSVSLGEFCGTGKVTDDYSATVVVEVVNGRKCETWTYTPTVAGKIKLRTLLTEAGVPAEYRVHDSNAAQLLIAYDWFKASFPNVPDNQIIWLMWHYSQSLAAIPLHLVKLAPEFFGFFDTAFSVMSYHHNDNALLPRVGGPYTTNISVLGDSTLVFQAVVHPFFVRILNDRISVDQASFECGITAEGFQLQALQYENEDLVNLLNSKNPDTQYALQYRLLEEAIIHHLEKHVLKNEKLTGAKLALAQKTFLTLYKFTEQHKIPMDLSKFSKFFDCVLPRISNRMTFEKVKGAKLANFFTYEIFDKDNKIIASLPPTTPDKAGEFLYVFIKHYYDICATEPKLQLLGNPVEKIINKTSISYGEKLLQILQHAKADPKSRTAKAVAQTYYQLFKTHQTELRKPDGLTLEDITTCEKLLKQLKLPYDVSLVFAKKKLEKTTRVQENFSAQDNSSALIQPDPAKITAVFKETQDDIAKTSRRGNSGYAFSDFVQDLVRNNFLAGDTSCWDYFQTITYEKIAQSLGKVLSKDEIDKLFIVFHKDHNRQDPDADALLDKKNALTGLSRRYPEEAQNIIIGGWLKESIPALQDKTPQEVRELFSCWFTPWHQYTVSPDQFLAINSHAAEILSSTAQSMRRDQRYVRVQFVPANSSDDSKHGGFLFEKDKIVFKTSQIDPTIIFGQYTHKLGTFDLSMSRTLSDTVSGRHGFIVENASPTTPLLARFLTANKNAITQDEFTLIVYNGLRSEILKSTETPQTKVNDLFVLSEKLHVPCNLSGVDLSGVDLSGVDFKNKNISGITIDNLTNLKDAKSQYVTFEPNTPFTYHMRDKEGALISQLIITPNEFFKECKKIGGEKAKTGDGANYLRAFQGSGANYMLALMAEFSADPNSEKGRIFAQAYYNSYKADVEKTLNECDYAVKSEVVKSLIDLARDLKVPADLSKLNLSHGNYTKIIFPKGVTFRGTDFTGATLGDFAVYADTNIQYCAFDGVKIAPNKKLTWQHLFHRGSTFTAYSSVTVNPGNISKAVSEAHVPMLSRESFGQKLLKAEKSAEVKKEVTKSAIEKDLLCLQHAQIEEERSSRKYVVGSRGNRTSETLGQLFVNTATKVDRIMGLINTTQDNGDGTSFTQTVGSVRRKLSLSGFASHDLRQATFADKNCYKKIQAARNSTYFTGSKLNPKQVYQILEWGFGSVLLQGTVLSDLDLRGLNFDANLCGVWLNRADLRGANLTGATIDTNTDFTGVIVDAKTNFPDAKLSAIQLKQIMASVETYKNTLDSPTHALELSNITAKIFVWDDRLKKLEKPAPQQSTATVATVVTPAISVADTATPPDSLRSQSSTPATVAIPAANDSARTHTSAKILAKGRRDGMFHTPSSPRKLISASPASPGLTPEPGARDSLSSTGTTTPPPSCGESPTKSPTSLSFLERAGTPPRNTPLSDTPDTLVVGGPPTPTSSRK